MERRETRFRGRDRLRTREAIAARRRPIAGLLGRVVALLLASVAMSVVALPKAPASAQRVGVSPLSVGPAAGPELRRAVARFGALRAFPSVGVEVLDEHVTASCQRASEGWRCELEARWAIHSEESRTVRLYASAEGAHAVSLRASDVSTDAPSSTPLELELEADRPIEVVLHAEVTLDLSGRSNDAIDGRHMLLGTPRTGLPTSVAFTRAVARTFERVPSTLDVSYREEAPAGLRAQALGIELLGTPTAIPAEILGDRMSFAIELERTADQPILRNGGPVLGIGATFEGRLRGRLGYEIGLVDFLLVDVHLDTDFTDLVAVGGVIEIAAPFFDIPISPAIGLGGVYRARTRDDAPIPAHSGGLRFEATLALPVIGVVASFDYFPDDGAFTSSVLARLSL